MAFEGPEGLRNHLVAHLEAVEPTALLNIRGRLGLTAEDLPDARVIPAVDEVLRVPLEQWPFHFVVVRDVPGALRQGGGEFTFRYVVRVFTFARGEGADAAMRARERYTLALRECLFERRVLTGVGGAAVATRMPTDTWRESYSEVNPGGPALGSVGAAYVETEVHRDETA